MMLDDARRLFRYDHWANGEVVRALRAAREPPPQAVRRLAHIAAAEQRWLDRLRRQPRRLPVWPELSLERSAALLEEMAWEWAGYLGELTAARLGERVEYTNSKGEPWVNAVADVLHHVVMHSAYHRGQIAGDLRAAGHEPAYTDYIEAVRRGHLDS